jgi:hypothetical protein
MADKLSPSAAFAWGALATLYAATAALSISDRSPVEDNLRGMLDLPGKHYAAAVLDGASTGMKENGWSNFSIERRLDVMRKDMNPDFNTALKPVYDQAYEQGLAGEWDEAALDGYLQVVEMPGRHIYHFNKATLEGDEKINPEALSAKIEADYGTQWDAVGQHFRKGLEGMILTTVTATEYAKEILDNGTFEFEEMGSPIRYAAEVHGFMTNGPNDPVQKADASQEIEQEVVEQEPVERIPVDTTMRKKVKVELERERKPITWNVMTGKLTVEDPFADEPAVQVSMTDELKF